MQTLVTRRALTIGPLVIAVAFCDHLQLQCELIVFQKTH